MLQGYNKESIYLKKLFKKLFENKIDDVLETRIYGKLSLYMSYSEDQDFLENFVKEYFIMRNKAVANRNTLINKVESEEHKKSSIFNKIKANKSLNYWQNLCDRLIEFETEFFEITNISILRTENERLDKIKKQNNTIEK